MSKNIIDKAQIQQSFASKIWQKVKERFHKTPEKPAIAISDIALESIHQDLSLLEDDFITIETTKKEEVEVEITLEELQSALLLLDTENKNLATADDAIQELIHALKKSEQPSQEKTSNHAKAVEVVIEFIPLSHHTKAPVHNAFQPNQKIYREIRPDDMSEKLKREKEQRELAKKITHYPPSDRLH